MGFFFQNCIICFSFSVMLHWATLKKSQYHLQVLYLLFWLLLSLLLSILIWLVFFQLTLLCSPLKKNPKQIPKIQKQNTQENTINLVLGISSNFRDSHWSGWFQEAAAFCAFVCQSCFDDLYHPRDFLSHNSEPTCSVSLPFSTFCKNQSWALLLIRFLKDLWNSWKKIKYHE